MLKQGRGDTRKKGLLPVMRISPVVVRQQRNGGQRGRITKMEIPTTSARIRGVGFKSSDDENDIEWKYSMLHLDVTKK